MVGIERYLFIATATSLVRVHLSPLLIHGKNHRQRIPLDSDSINCEKIKLPLGTFPLYIDRKLYLVGSETAVVEVALDVPWDIDNAPIWGEDVKVHVPVPFVGCSVGIPQVAEFEDKIFFFHCNKTDENGNKYGGEVLNLKTRLKSFINSPPPFGLDVRIAIQYTWSPYYSVNFYTTYTRHTFDMRTEEWLEPWPIIKYGDLSFHQVATTTVAPAPAARGNRFPNPFFFTHHAVVHLGENLYITFAGNCLRKQPVHLVLYQFASDDQTQICNHVLFELDTLFMDTITTGHHLVNLGGGVISLVSIVAEDDLQLATFQVNGIGKKTMLLSRSICLPSVMPKSSYNFKPCFIFTRDDHPVVAWR